MPDAFTARADLAGNASTSKYRSENDAWWATFGAALVADELKQEVVITEYEPFSVNLLGGSYTPDFLHILADGRQVLVELKGASEDKARPGKLTTRTRNARDARSKIRAAAEKFWYWDWYEVRKAGRGAFQIEHIANGRHTWA